jgi:hypothetical protein
MAAVALGTGISQGTGAMPPKQGIAGETLIVGDLVMEDPVDNRIRRAPATALSTPRIIGVALNGASAGNPVNYHWHGLLLGTATLVKGTSYFASPTAGSVGLAADVLSGQYPAFVGIAASATSIDIKPHCPGVSVP